LGPVPSGKLDESTARRMSMSGFVRRSFCHRYHSLGFDRKVWGRPRIAGCDGSSTRSTADVGRQVLLT
jgi:hypothetical protein